MKSNEELQRDVQNAIKWEPLLNAAEIGVTTKDGVVTLTGVVSSYAKKVEAENAAKSVLGVRAIAEKIIIEDDEAKKKDDSELANEIIKIWKMRWDGLYDDIQLKVENGWAKIYGQVEWNYQREDITAIVANVAGIKGITNNITIQSKSIDRLEKEAISYALDRSWAINPQNIKINVDGDVVKLTGSVGSMYQKDEASRLAWNTPGVKMVDNQLIVNYA